MLSALKKLLFGEPVDFAALIASGATILDVRSQGEYEGGHIKGSLNIPVNKLQNNLTKLKNKEKPIIACCASGARSASAVSLLKSAGYTNVHNGGSWMSLRKYYNKK